MGGGSFPLCNGSAGPGLRFASLLFPRAGGFGGGAQRGLGWQQLSSVSFPCLHKCVNDYLFIFGWLDCSLNNIFPEEGDLNILQHLRGRRVLPDERVAAPREEMLNSGLMARDVETLKYSQSLSYRYLSFYIDTFLDKPLLLR